MQSLTRPFKRPGATVKGQTVDCDTPDPNVMEKLVGTSNETTECVDGKQLPALIDTGSTV